MRVDRKSRKGPRGKSKGSLNRSATDNETTRIITLDTTDTSQEVNISHPDSTMTNNLESTSAPQVKLETASKYLRVSLVNLIYTDLLTVQQRQALTEKNRQSEDTSLEIIDGTLTKNVIKKKKKSKHDITISSGESIFEVPCLKQSTSKLAKVNPQHQPETKKRLPKETIEVRGRKSCGIRNESEKETLSLKPRKKRKRKILEVNDKPISIHSSSHNSSCIIIGEQKNLISPDGNPKRDNTNEKKSCKSEDPTPKVVEKLRKNSKISKSSFESFIQDESQRYVKKTKKSRNTKKKDVKINLDKLMKIDSPDKSRVPLKDFTRFANQSNLPEREKESERKLKDSLNVSISFENPLYQTIVPSTTENKASGIAAIGPRENYFPSHINGDSRSEDLVRLPPFLDLSPSKIHINPVLEKKHSSLDSIARAIDIDRAAGNCLSPLADCNIINAEIINLPVDPSSLSDVPDLDRNVSAISNNQEHPLHQKKDKPNEKADKSVTGTTSLQNTSTESSGSTASFNSRKRKPVIIKDDLLPKGMIGIPAMRPETPHSDKKRKTSNASQHIPINDNAITADVVKSYSEEKLSVANKNWVQIPQIAALLNDASPKIANEHPTVICQDAINNNGQAYFSKKNEPKGVKTAITEYPTVPDNATVDDELNAMRDLLITVDGSTFPDSSNPIKISNAQSKIVTSDTRQIDEISLSFVPNEGNKALPNVEPLESAKVKKIEKLTIKNLDKFNSTLGDNNANRNPVQLRGTLTDNSSNREQVDTQCIRLRKRKWAIDQKADLPSGSSIGKIKLVRRHCYQGGNTFFEGYEKVDDSLTPRQIVESQMEESKLLNHDSKAETRDESVLNNKDNRINNSRDVVDEANFNNFSKISSPVKNVQTYDDDVHPAIPGFGATSIYIIPPSSPINEDDESSGSSSSSTSSSSSSSRSSSSGTSGSKSIPIDSTNQAEPCSQIEDTLVPEEEVEPSVAMEEFKDLIVMKKIEPLVGTKKIEALPAKMGIEGPVASQELKLPVRTEELATSVLNQKLEPPATTEGFEPSIMRQEFEDPVTTEVIETPAERNKIEAAVETNKIVAPMENEKTESLFNEDELQVDYEIDDLEDLRDAETLAGNSSIAGSFMENDSDAGKIGDQDEEDCISLFAESLNTSRCESPPHLSKFPRRRSPIVNEPYDKMKSENIGAFVSANKRECEATFEAYRDNVSKPETILEIRATSKGLPLLPNTREISNDENQTTKNQTGPKVDLRLTLKNRLQSRDMVTLFRGQCFHWLKVGNCNLLNTCTFRHGLKPQLQEIQHYDPKTLDEILTYAISKRYSTFIEIVQKKAAMNMEVVQIMALYSKLYQAKLLTILHIENTIDVLKERGLSLREILTYIEDVLVPNDVVTHTAVMSAFHKKLEAGTCWEILGKIMSKVMPMIPMVETVLMESIEKNCISHTTDVYMNMIRKIPNHRRSEINDELLRKFEDMVNIGQSTSAFTTSVQPQIRGIDIPDWTCGIISPESPRPEEFLPAEEQQCQSAVFEKILAIATSSPHKKIQASSGRSRESHGKSQSSSSCSEDNSYVLRVIDKLPPAKSPYRDKLWKFHWDLQGVQEGLVNRDYVHVVSILSQYAQCPNRLPHIGGFYKILCNEIMLSKHHMAEIVRVTVQSGSSDAVRQYVYDLGIYVLTNLADTGSWLLAYDLLKTFHVYGSYNTCAVTLLAAEIYIANERPLKALALLKQSRIVFTNSRMWNQMQCPKDEAMRVSVMDLLLYSLCDSNPDQALALLEFIVADQCSNFKPINVGIHVERIARRLLLEKRTSSIIDMGRLIIKAHMLVSTAIFRALINQIFHDDRLLAKQLQQYSSWLGTYNRPKINNASCAHMIVNTAWTEEETYLMISSLLEELYINIGHAIDRLKVRQLNVFLIFESIPTERQLMMDVSEGSFRATAINKQRAMVKSVLERFDPKIKVVQKMQGRVCKLQSQSLVDYLKSGQLKR